jgi:aspartyl-tRNA(Asn)/glutamyl-tRNA(Gln) amidotransferase subunit C
MDVETVRKVAKVARLRLSPNEEAQFARDLEEVLNYFSILDQAPSVETHDFNPVRISDILREDVPGQDIEPEILKGSMDTYQDMVRGPKLS